MVCQRGQEWREQRCVQGPSPVSKSSGHSVGRRLGSMELRVCLERFPKSSLDTSGSPGRLLSRGSICEFIPVFHIFASTLESRTSLRMIRITVDLYWFSFHTESRDSWEQTQRPRQQSQEGVQGDFGDLSLSPTTAVRRELAHCLMERPGTVSQVSGAHHSPQGVWHPFAHLHSMNLRFSIVRTVTVV